MSRRRGLVVALAALLLAVGVAIAIATGGDEGEPSPEADAPATEAGSNQANGDAQAGSEASEPEQSPEADSDAYAAALERAGEVERIDPPPPLEGQGDDSIETFGEEAADDEAEEVATVVSAFLWARARGDWDAACALTSQRIADQLAQFQAQAEEAGDEVPTLDCPTFLRSGAGRVPERELRRLARVRLGSVRTEDDRAFAIYKSAESQWTFMMLEREGGDWRVAMLDSTPLR